MSALDLSPAEVLAWVVAVLVLTLAHVTHPWSTDADALTLGLACLCACVTCWALDGPSCCDRCGARSSRPSRSLDTPSEGGEP